ncbi:ABC transporter ATP-binding protein [Staphylococcus sp. GSSP0090]|nr:ABC transporter ATP-binding protein [Staphylococcus sp. GSSP0090]
MLKIDNLYKRFKGADFNVIDGVSLTIHRGEVVGLIGKNGAGKTTLMKMIAKTKRPTSGTILLNDIDIFKHHNVLKNVGIMIDTVHFKHFSAKKNLSYYLKVNQKEHYLKNIDPILELVGLSHTNNKKANDFSFGMKQRLSLAMCLVDEPEIAIMDEPFVGLDPDGVNTLIHSLRTWASQKGTALLISSHQLNELAEVCDRFVLLKNGKLQSIDFNKEQLVKIVVKEHIYPEHSLELLNLFSTITEIKENAVIIQSGSKEYNDIINYLIKYYTLENTINEQDNLYQYFDGFERK